MNMVSLAVHLNKLGFEIATHLAKDRAQALECVRVEHLAAIFGYKDQMDMQLENTVSAMANIVVIGHRPTYTTGMQRLQAFKYQLRPSAGQACLMRRFAGSCRFVYNKALALQKERYEKGEPKAGYAGLCKLLTEWRNSVETPWLKDAPTHPLQQSLKDLERAYGNFFAGRADFPRFKKKGRWGSFRYPDPIQIKLDQPNERIFLPKLGWMRYRNSRPVLGEVKQITVSGCGEKWFVSIQTERDVQAPRHQSASMAGVDLGVAAFATLSDGHVYAPINSYRKRQKRLAFLQRRLSAKTKFSANWKKARSKVQKLHTNVANCRLDFLHKTSTEISKNHAVIVIEDLAVQNMAARAAGSVEQPGRNVKAKAGLNRAILDQGWNELRRQLGYKQSWRGGAVIIVPAQNTSRTCPTCGHVSAQNRRTREKFECIACAYQEGADLVAARNILAAGHAVLACGEPVLSDRSEKQESTVLAA